MVTCSEMAVRHDGEMSIEEKAVRSNLILTAFWFVLQACIILIFGVETLLQKASMFFTLTPIFSSAFLYSSVIYLRNAVVLRYPVKSKRVYAMSYCLSILSAGALIYITGTALYQSAQ